VLLGSSAVAATQQVSKKQRKMLEHTFQSNDKKAAVLAVTVDFEQTARRPFVL
jgi:hypothetical protein